MNIPNSHCLIFSDKMVLARLFKGPSLRKVDSPW